MITHRFLALCLSVAVLVSAPRAIAQQEMVAHWNRPFEPFRIIGNVHYVGTNELGAYLITSKEGHALIDGGFAETAPLILASIRALGFDPKDVKMLLTTQAHMDHVGSMAGLKAATGAQTVIMEQDAAVMERGGQRDFTFGDSFTFPPVRVDRRLKDGAMVRVGDTTLTARLTAGHTQGCTTWTMTADDGGR
jgi:metallo-beta-lactamase class B